MIHFPSILSLAADLGLFESEGGSGKVEGEVLDLNSVSDWLIRYDSYTVVNRDGDIDLGYRYGQYVDYPIVLPRNRNVEVKVTSADVIHCWTIHGLGVKIDAVPGRVNTSHLTDLRSGFSG